MWAKQVEDALQERSWGGTFGLLPYGPVLWILFPDDELVRHVLLNHMHDEELWWNGKCIPDSRVGIVLCSLLLGKALSLPQFIPAEYIELFEFTRCKYTPSHFCIYWMWAQCSSFSDTYLEFIWGGATKQSSSSCFCCVYMNWFS